MLKRVNTFVHLLGWFLAAAGTVPMVAPGTAEAKEARIPLVDQYTIEDEGGNARVLVGTGDLSAYQGELVLSAFLEFVLPGNIPAENLEVEVYGVVTDWSGSKPTWSTPWTVPGGDLSDDTYDKIVLRKGRAAVTLQLDVTDDVRSMIDGDGTLHGFMLVPAGKSKVGFGAQDKGVLGVLSGELVVSYREVSRHIKNGRGES